MRLSHRLNAVGTALENENLSVFFLNMSKRAVLIGMILNASLRFNRHEPFPHIVTENNPIEYLEDDFNN